MTAAIGAAAPVGPVAKKRGAEINTNSNVRLMAAALRHSELPLPHQR
jgi:hypothetical protein